MHLSQESIDLIQEEKGLIHVLVNLNQVNETWFMYRLDSI